MQYKIETLFTTQGARTYYVEADNADSAVKKFEKEVVKNNQTDERIYTMTEDVRTVDAMSEDERVDVQAVKEARVVEWEEQMNIILARSRKKLKDTMGFGVPDEMQDLKS
tara:strand:+ start:237 stop:566 length:330 start_codon:yes stop_codon:yes gene_type:complete